MILIKLIIYKMIISDVVLRPFTENDIKNKELILEMLKYEDERYLSMEGQEFLRTYGNISMTLESSKVFQRETLIKFGFSSTDDDLKLYRRIFHNYYKSPIDYDKDVLSSVYYMRENKLLYYTEPVLKIGDKIVDVPLLDSEGNKCQLFDVINDISIKHKKDKFIIAGFSLSWPPFIRRLNELIDTNKHNLDNLILIQISEAHTKKWPIGYVDHPEQQNNLDDRINRMKEFKKIYNQNNVFNNVYVDLFENTFENTYHAWPDKYYYVDSNFIILDKSRYDDNAVLINDYYKLL